MTITKEARAKWKALCDAAFKGPWRYHKFEIEFDYSIDHSNSCPQDGYTPDCVEVEAPDEYPDGQCVCQQNVLLVPGLEQFADANGAFIAAAREAVPKLLADLDVAEAAATDNMRMVNNILDTLCEHAGISTEEDRFPLLIEWIGESKAAREKAGKRKTQS